MSAPESRNFPSRCFVSGPRVLAFAVFVVWALGPAAVPAAAASAQLSAGLSYSDISFNPTRPQISPDGQYAVYVQDAVTDNAFELWSVRVTGGRPQTVRSTP